MFKIGIKPGTQSLLLFSRMAGEGVWSYSKGLKPWWLRTGQGKGVETPSDSQPPSWAWQLGLGPCVTEAGWSYIHRIRIQSGGKILSLAFKSHLSPLGTSWDAISVCGSADFFTFCFTPTGQYLSIHFRESENNSNISKPLHVSSPRLRVFPACLKDVCTPKR